MAIFRCNKCGHIREVGNEYTGKSVKCPKCQTITSIHNAVTLINALIKKYLEQKRELQTLKKEAATPEKVLTESIISDDIDVHNTDILTQDSNLNPILNWFAERAIIANINPEAVDTTGFFDEIALSLGENYKTLSFVSNQIKYVQNKGYETVKLDLNNKNKEEIQAITSFCKQLHEYAFIAKYFHKKKDDLIYLTLHNVPKIKAFFNGIWMEWFVFIKLLELFHERKISPACVRSVKISFNENESNELDLFCLTENNIPFCIECKSGEFRQDMAKMLALKKKLAIGSHQFIICILGLSEEQTKGMTAMYGLTFVNETSFIEHIKRII